MDRNWLLAAGLYVFISIYTGMMLWGLGVEGNWNKPPYIYCGFGALWPVTGVIIIVTTITNGASNFPHQ